MFYHSMKAFANITVLLLLLLYSALIYSSSSSTSSINSTINFSNSFTYKNSSNMICPLKETKSQNSNQYSTILFVPCMSKVYANYLYFNFICVDRDNNAQVTVARYYYVGPIFNTMAGLGLSLVVSAWSTHPKPFVIPVGHEMLEILGFVVGIVVWALLILPKREMIKVDRVLGVGFLLLSSCFLSLRLSQSLGLL